MNLNIQRFWKKRSVTITEYDPTYKVVYLGNVLTAWAKGDGCVDKPLATLWKNYCQNVKPDVGMKVTVGNSGLKAVTKEHGLTEYWSNRVTYCAAHTHYPRVFCWVYRHEGKRLRQELRCHAVLCRKEEQARRMASQLQHKLALALQEFKREKICRQNARLSLANCVYDNPSLPRRKILLSTGSINYRPPLERSKTAPKLMAIEEAGETKQHNHRQRESPFRTRGGRRRQTYPPSSSTSAFEEFGIIKEDQEEEDEDAAGVVDGLDELDDDVLVDPATRRTNAANSRDEPYRNFLLREYQLQQRRQRLLTSPIRVRFNRYGEEEERELQLDPADDEQNDNDCVVDVTDLDEVRLLLEETGMTSSSPVEAEVEAALLLADDYDSVAADTFTCNPRAGSTGSSEAERRHHHSHHHHRRGSTDNDNDGFDTSSSAHSSPLSSSGPSSTNSSPLSSVREGRRDAATTPSEGAADDDIVSDESGYSEDNLNCAGQQQRHPTVTRTFTCDI